MKPLRSPRLWLAFAGLVLLAAAARGPERSTLHVRIEGLRNADGSVHLGFYESAAQWKTERSNFQRHASKSGCRGGVLELTITDVAPGRYAMAMVDDENDSGGMDWGLLMPKEGFGFSNYEHRGLSRPDFEDFDFELPAGGEARVVMRVRYL